jgi:CheY-like chemotaxis protein
LSDKTIVPHTLLLADDSVTIQRVIELTFADEDVNVITVSDGDQAIQRIEAAPPDIVLADIGMPGKNGYEVAQHIRQSPRLAHIPVVLLTGAFEPVDQARAAEAGCDGVLAKPFEPQLVIGRVKELLAKSHAKGYAHAPAAAAPPPRTEPAKGGWPPAPPEPPMAAASAPTQAGPPSVDLHDYFDRLDAAFSNLTPGAPPPPTAPAPPPPSDIDWFSAQASSSPPADSWDFAEAQEPPPPTDASPPPPAEAFPVFEPPEAVAPAPSAEAPVPSSFAGDFPPVAPPAIFDVPPPPPPVADTQATIASMPPSTAGVPIAAPPAAPPQSARVLGQPASLPPLADAFAALLAAEQDEPVPANVPLWPAASAPAVDDALVEDITRRVLERLSDQVVRETVDEIVSRVAEQLVRQEIERIKAQLR